MSNLRRAVALGAAALAAAGAAMFTAPAANAADTTPATPDNAPNAPAQDSCAAPSLPDGGLFGFLNSMADGTPGPGGFGPMCGVARYLLPPNSGFMADRSGDGSHHSTDAGGGAGTIPLPSLYGAPNLVS